MVTTRVLRHIRAPRDQVFRALIDPTSVQEWMVPDEMTSKVHHLDARENGTFRIDLTHDDPSKTGESGGASDTYEGRFTKIGAGTGGRPGRGI